MPYQEDGCCRYGYPQPFRETTGCIVDGNPHYRRPDNGVIVATSNRAIADNRWI
ncbi:hypothetical protein DFQ26_000742, partial [Actinomortierella ambigua]